MNFTIEKEASVKQPTAIHNTFVIERNYPVPPERVFLAFADTARKRRWFAESKNQDVEVFEQDFRVGGMEKTRYRFRPGTPFPGTALSTEGVIQDILPDRRIVTASTMSLGDKRISATLVTIELLPNGSGTDLICTHQGTFFEGADGPPMRAAAWPHLFVPLAKELAH